MRVLVCRPDQKGEELVDKLKLSKIEAFHTPLIQIQLGDDLPKLPTVLADLTHQTEAGLVFLFSPNVFRYYENVIAHAHSHSLISMKPVVWPATLYYFAIGRSTAKRFNEITRLEAEYPEKREISENLIQHPKLNALIRDAHCKKALILRGNDGRDFTANWLSKQGVEVTILECYKRNLLPIETSQILARFEVSAGLGSQKVENVIVVTSGEMLTHLAQSVKQRKQPNEINTLFQSTLIVVSERLAQIAKQLGWIKIELADNADNQSLYNKIIQLT